MLGKGKVFRRQGMKIHLDGSRGGCVDLQKILSRLKGIFQTLIIEVLQEVLCRVPLSKMGEAVRLKESRPAPVKDIETVFHRFHIKARMAD